MSFSIETCSFYVTDIQQLIIRLHNSFFPKLIPSDGHLRCSQLFAFIISALINSHSHVSFHVFVHFFHMPDGQEKMQLYGSHSYG